MELDKAYTALQNAGMGGGSIQQSMERDKNIQDLLKLQEELVHELDMMKRDIATLAMQNTSLEGEKDHLLAQLDQFASGAPVLAVRPQQQVGVGCQQVWCVLLHGVACIFSHPTHLLATEESAEVCRTESAAICSARHGRSQRFAPVGTRDPDSSSHECPQAGTCFPLGGRLLNKKSPMFCHQSPMFWCKEPCRGVHVSGKSITFPPLNSFLQLLRTQPQTYAHCPSP